MTGTDCQDNNLNAAGYLWQYVVKQQQNAQVANVTIEYQIED